MRRIKSHARRVYRCFAAELAHAKQFPKRSAALTAVGILLVWMVLTASFADFVAVSSPETALWLNASHPKALLTLAERQLRTLQKPLDQHKAGSATTTAPASTPTASTGIQQTAEPAEATRAAIRDLANRAIAGDPLSGHAYRLLGETTDDPAMVRAIMREALIRSRRESLAAAWLLRDAFERGDFADTVAKADMLLRTRPGASNEVMKYLGAVASSPEGKTSLVDVLERNPPWRSSFFNALPNATGAPDTPLSLMLALKERGSPPEPKELAAYLRFLVARNYAAFAYDAWLQFLPPEKADELGLLHNGSFKEPFGEIPFDWQIARGTNAVAALYPMPNSEGAKALHFSFGSGRVKFPRITQIVALAPGRYRFEGVLQGVIVAKRGLRWQFQCHGAKTPPTETEMLYGDSRAVQLFELHFEVPNRDDCRAQIIRLIHDARSASEEMVTGQISVQELSLTRQEQ